MPTITTVLAYYNDRCLPTIRGPRPGTLACFGKFSVLRAAYETYRAKRDGACAGGGNGRREGGGEGGERGGRKKPQGYRPRPHECQTSAGALLRAPVGAGLNWMCDPVGGFAAVPCGEWARGGGAGPAGIHCALWRAILRVARPHGHTATARWSHAGAEFGRLAFGSRLPVGHGKPSKRSASGHEHTTLTGTRACGQWCHSPAAV